MLIGDRLRKLREEKKLSQGDIEKRTGLLRAYISRVEHGHTTPTIQTLEKIARALEVPLYRLFYESNKPPKVPNLLRKSPAEIVPVSVPCVSGLNGRGTPSGQAPAKIDVTWTEIPIAVSYNVLRGTVSGGPYTLLGNAVLPAFSDTNGLVNGGTYYYIVQPINSAGGVICRSNEAAIAIPNQSRLPELP